MVPGPTGNRIKAGISEEDEDNATARRGGIGSRPSGHNPSAY